jgi:hypothetical protein
VTQAERHERWNPQPRASLQIRQIHQEFRFWSAWIDAYVRHGDLMPECLWMLDKMACVGSPVCYGREY